LTRDVLVDLALVGWFVALAVAEVAFTHNDQPRQSVDDGRLLTNFGLTGLILLATGILPLANIASAEVGAGIGLAYHVHLPWIALFALTWLGQSFAAYWAHRWMHAVPLLWRVHRVHHADTAVDVSTSLRNHPLELLVMIPASALVILVLGAPVSVVVAVQSILVAAAIWEHADIMLPKRLDRALSFLLVTPRLHRLHHSPDRGNHDSNYGNSLTLWDRLFGTLNDRQERLEVGLTRQRAAPNRLLDQICSPLHAT
jgi:sterol desaturase/sphingolipid hydroxylase (fatty acid hydroxylase superfamily)